MLPQNGLTLAWTGSEGPVLERFAGAYSCHYSGYS